MWKLHMDNDKFKEVAAERQEQGMDMEAFIERHQKVHAALKDLGEEVHEDFVEIGERLE